MSSSLLLFAAFLLPTRVFAWEIARFEVAVVVHEDATATVTETIAADFGSEARHGIYRDIPILYTDRAGQSFRLRLHVEAITDDAGRPWRYTLSRVGRYQRLRIGDPNVTLSGSQIYRLRYLVQRGAIRFFPDHDECYWNLTGNEWAVPMRQVRAEIQLPRSVRGMRAIAYVGGYGSIDRSSEVTVRPDGILIEPSRSLAPYEGVTAVVGWEKGVVHLPSRWQVVRWWFADNWVYGIPLLVLIGMTWWWALRGRDPRTNRSQVVQYAPPEGVTPAEAGTLWDQRVQLRDITSTIIDLAVRGYLRIEPHQATALGTLWPSTEYRLVNLKSWQGDAQLKPHERDVLKGLFDTPLAVRELADLEEKFYQQLPAVRDAIYTGLVKAGYFDSHPERIRTHYFLIGCLGGSALWMALSALQRWQEFSWPITLASAGSVIIIALFSRIMPRRTLAGARLTDHLAGFLEFLRRTDQDRLRRLNDPHLFERCLPYALAFGVASQWAKAFQGLSMRPPSWYAGQWDTFSTDRFTRDVSRATTSMGRSLSATPGGSSDSWGGSGGGGGGSSGGGGGGGGGGAW